MIKPKLLKGTKDYLPLEVSRREHIFSVIKSIYKKYGYEGIETPVIEYAETLLGKYGEEGEKLTYNFKDHGDRHIALRYDLTVPFARCFVMNVHELGIPFKKYQIGRVWRADKPQKARLREFYQCDVDIIGSESLVSEAELGAIAYEVLSTLKFKNFHIRYNSRTLINQILQKFEIAEENKVKAIQTIDKLDKIGPEKVIELLEPICNKAGDLMEYIRTEDPNSLELVQENPEIQEFQKYSQMYKVPDKHLKLDLTLARGLDYYTGIVFEFEIPEFPAGSIGSGGRYANLASTFTKENYSGVGISFGFERVYLAMEELNLFDEIDINTQILLTLFDENSIKDTIELRKILLDKGYSVELYLKPKDKLSKQLKYADKKGIPYVIIYGPDEISQGLVTLKDLKKGTQKQIKINDLEIT